jgi:hypothetical protein
MNSGVSATEIFLIPAKESCRLVQGKLVFLIWDIVRK